MRHRKSGFTIVELIVVIVVIAILAAITLVAYTSIQNRAHTARAESDLSELQKAIQSARLFKGKPLKDITGSTYTASPCRTKANSVDLATLPKTDTCWTRYQQTLDAISEASGLNVSGLVDPWGRPYDIDENEGEGTGCTMDTISAYQNPRNGTAMLVRIQVPLSKFTNANC